MVPAASHGGAELGLSKLYPTNPSLVLRTLYPCTFPCGLLHHLVLLLLFRLHATILSILR
jgi:hypothetical protein